MYDAADPSTIPRMEPDRRVRQGIVLADRRGVRVVAASDGFPTPDAERIAVLFGQRPAGVACPPAHFACPCGRKFVAVVRVEDRPVPGVPDPALGFRFLVLARDLYRFLGDPFAVADRYPPPWDAAGPLPELEWPREVLPPRAVADVQTLLKAGDAGLLLGGVQGLIDGAKLVVRRPAPDELLMRGLWQLLPTKTRPDLWPASFAFSNDLGFHAVALPAVPDTLAPGELTEDQARDYPPGRYELNLQIAAEAGDQADLDGLFDRRTSQETLRLGLTIIALAVAAAVVAKLLM